MATERSPRLMLSDMSVACRMAVSFLKATVAYSQDKEEASMASLLLKTLEARVAESDAYLSNQQAYDERCEVYLEQAREIATQIEWIKLPDHGSVLVADGGAYVEAVLFISDEDVEVENG
jgi:hypothetical protein